MTNRSTVSDGLFFHGSSDVSAEKSKNRDALISNSFVFLISSERLLAAYHSVNL